MTIVAAQRPLGRYDGIQLLRFLAAAIVLVAHATIYTHERLDPRVPVWDLGGAGVDVFFVISGFVIVLAARGRAPGSWVGWRSFLAKRALRIFPMYWAATTLNLVVLMAMPGAVLHSSFELRDLVQWYLLIPTFNPDGKVEPLLGVGWTLYFETFFYLLFTLSLALRRSPFLLIPPVLIACTIASAFRGAGWPAVGVYCDPRVLEFLCGMVIAHLAPRHRWPPMVGGWLVAAGIGILWASDGLVLWADFAARATAASALVMGMVVLEPVLAGRVGRVGLFLGASSYALYLLHPIFAPGVPQVLHALHIDSPGLSIAGAIAVGIVVSAVAHRWFEAPLMVAGSRWLKRHGGDVHPERNVAPDLSRPLPPA